MANINELSLKDLRQAWHKAWGFSPHSRIGRKMLERSLMYKLKDLEGRGLTYEQSAKLESLIKAYKSDRFGFLNLNGQIKAGTRLIRVWDGKRHIVQVQGNGFEYNGQTYRSLSKIASEITGTRWNGWVFFGVKRRGKAP